MIDAGAALQVTEQSLGLKNLTFLKTHSCCGGNSYFTSICFLMSHPRLSPPTPTGLGEI